MFELFTDRSRQVIARAQDQARALDHPAIGTEHLLLALVAEDGGPAARALTSIGLTHRDLVHRLGGTGPRPDGGPVASHIPFTPRMKRVLELSLRESKRLADRYIGTEHLLLGLIREGEGRAVGLIGDSGVDLGALAELVVRSSTSEEPDAAATRVHVVRHAGLDDHVAGRIADRLDLRDRPTAVVADLDAAEAVIVVVGKDWTTAADADGRTRLARVDDPVHVAIDTALRRGLRTVVALVDDQRAPAADDLPEPLRGLVSAPVVELRYETFHDNLDALIDVLRGRR
ncbi:hypothetical protein GCM10022243_43750 [Saccharothrix violaceirubra]|uniref:Clp R domain-containing protein n=1 Tax=Saccharothrix violaceirubra TaxID=413306 RepID=A0A7W7T336_9PSEU|nr:Clp protease N-terminal domain-containing protein [Saccharothrix violaceirubra]MBB4965664.1 hypothetical protein [Saccharothrix violaceirubra]